MSSLRHGTIARKIDQDRAASADDIQTLAAENFWAAFAAARAAERLTLESREREPVASRASRMMSGIAAIVLRGQELGLIRVDLPIDLLVAWFRAIDGARDDWLVAQLTQPDP